MSILHVIRLEQNHFFIGNPNNAMIQFKNDPVSESTKWFRTYMPVYIEQIIQKEDLYRVTLEYKAIYGDDKVHCDNQDNQDNQDNEEISKLEYLQPEFGNKFREFINYKKDLMLREIEKLVEKYNNNKNNKIDDLYLDILSYVKKYRIIACPNMYFEKQLRMLLNGKL